MNPCAHSQNTGTPRRLARDFGTLRDTPGRCGTPRDVHGRALVLPGGRRLPALADYPRSLPCLDCGVDLAGAAADIHIAPDARALTLRCPACDLAERCGAGADG